ncbi:MAG: hypothetical protein GX490_01705 [Bacilli bacterium]|nr:hypothetical protein [Bacilli bacterium]
MKTSDKIVFLGDSLTANFKLLNQFANIINLGVGGDKTIEILNRMDACYSHNPNKLFLLIGINDFLVNKKVWKFPEEIDITKNYDLILNNLKTNLPNTQVYCISILPLGRNTFFNREEISSYNLGIKELNLEIKQLAEKYGYTYLDFHDNFADYEGYLQSEFTLDGVHLTEAGYQHFLDLLRVIIC